MPRLSVGLALVVAACEEAPSEVIPDAMSQPADAAPQRWHPPACTTITGTGAVTFTHDDGATLAPTSQLTGVSLTMGLVALSTPNTLLVAHAGHVLRSEDAGCTWRDLGAVAGDLVLVAAGERAYGYVDNQPVRVRIDPDRITRLDDHGTGIVGMAADQDDASHLRLVDANAQLWESTDGGATWSAIGILDIGQRIVYRAAFAPDDLDHIVVGASLVGVHVTRDGGASWKQATGLSPGAANAMNLVVSPSDSRIVWATGIEIPEGTRHVWRSEDGGSTFASVVTGDEMQIVNGMDLFPHPTNTAVLYTTFGTSFQDYGTDLYRYEATTDTITRTHSAYHQIRAIAFLPSDPSWMWLGVSSSPINSVLPASALAEAAIAAALDGAASALAGRIAPDACSGTTARLEGACGFAF